ncbi:hypothetical protein EYF80_058842 [Liparis tanakae]|uniref:Uncharacterized protein n=1 Tax=Liparis tanakae TaxID=230148 RepID=A0A4Z2EQD7_9TELE|nr:hypothetical protein EYF80_058842 [Liparis tanakae]
MRADVRLGESPGERRENLSTEMTRDTRSRRGKPRFWRASRSMQSSTDRSPECSSVSELLLQSIEDAENRI